MESTKLLCVTVGLISFLDIFLFAALGLKISLSGQCGWPLRWHCFSRLVARQWAQPIQEMPARQAAMTIFQVFFGGWFTTSCLEEETSRTLVFSNILRNFASFALLLQVVPGLGIHFVPQEA